MATSSASTIADRYADALLAQVQDAASQDAVRAELAEWAAAAAPDGALHALATNPTLPRGAVAKTLAELAAKHKAHPAMARLLPLLAEQRRLPLLPTLSARYDAKLRQLRGRQAAVVTSAVALSEAQRQALAQTLGTTTDITWNTDPALLGGLVVEIDGRTLDLSVSAKLAAATRLLSSHAA